MKPLIKSQEDYYSTLITGTTTLSTWGKETVNSIHPKKRGTLEMHCYSRISRSARLLNMWNHASPCMVDEHQCSQGLLIFHNWGITTASVCREPSKQETATSKMNQLGLQCNFGNVLWTNLDLDCIDIHKLSMISHFSYLLLIIEFPICPLWIKFGIILTVFHLSGRG